MEEEILNQHMALESVYPTERILLLIETQEHNKWDVLYIPSVLELSNNIKMLHEWRDCTIEEVQGRILDLGTDGFTNRWRESLNYHDEREK